MPISVGVRGFFEATLDAWWRGVHALTPTPVEGVITDRGPILRPGPGVPTTVSIPGIFDIVKVGAPDPTAPATIQNNRELAKVIRNSPEPEYAQGLGEIMTAVDNVRDVLALGMIAGRIMLAVNGAAEVLAAGGSIYLTAAGATEAAAVAEGGLLAVGLGELGAVGAATAVGSLILPVLAVVAAAFLIAEMAHWSAAAAIVGYAGLCRGPAEAAFAAIPAVIWGRGLKANVTKLSRINPWSVAHEVREVRAGGVATFVGREYIEGGRATAVLWGHGWLLGAVVGSITAGAFAAQRLLNGDTVKVETNRFTRDMQRVLGQSPIPGSNIALRAAQSAAECLWSLPNLIAVVDQIRPIDFAQILSANLLALDILQPYLNGREWRSIATTAADEGIPAPPIWAPWTRDLIAEYGITPEGGRRWAVPGAPATLNIRTVDGLFAIDLPKKLEAWFAKYNGWLEAAFCGSLLDSIVQRLYWIITESDDGLRETAVGPWKVLFSLAESNRQVLITYGAETVAAFFAACEAKMTAEGRNTLTPPELDDVAASVGMRLLVLAPPKVTPQ
jgi:hypothetical protein